MSQPAPIHICFYSTRCQWSKAFLEQLADTPYYKDFRFICVDPSPQRPPLPTWLKQTPTLVIRGKSEPLTDAEVMNWLSEQRIRQGPARPAGAEEVEPDPYLASEMGGSLGDSYSFLDDDTSAQGNGGTRVTHNFQFLHGQGAVSTKEATSFQASQTSLKRSKKEELLDQQMEQYMKSRDQGMPQRIARQ